MVLPGIEELAALIGVDPSMTLVQAAFASTKPRPTPLTCTPEIEGNQDAYQVRDISILGMNDTTPLAVVRQSELIVAGTCTTFENRGLNQYWIWTEESGHRLLDLTTVDHQFLAILPDRSIIASATANGKEFGVVRVMDEQLMEFEKAGRRHAYGLASNDQGLIGGWISGVDEQADGQGENRPAVWNSTGKLVGVLEGAGLLGAESGYVADINENAIALVSGTKQHQSMPIIWDVNTNQTWLLEPHEGIVATAIQSRKVIGFATDPNHRLVATSAELRGAWSIIEPIKSGWEPRSGGNNALILGYVRGDGFSKPSIRVTNTQIDLPNYWYHHGYPRAAASSGEIVGTSSADHGYHALLWTPVG
jgi:hypothetical protein